MTVPVIIAAQAAQQQKAAREALVDLFRLADATAESRAQSLSRLRLEPTPAFRELEAAGVIRSADRGHYYLHEAALIELRTQAMPKQQRAVLLVVMLVLAALLAGLVLVIAV